ncbi:sigma-70 family RNA polymerase sigma factor [Candidatus Phytoplasma australiense]|uniref:DNA-Directed RNA Polymerase Sigma Subunit n=1 Tax=Strawberry lethal yellows phytoplasma (CPA) str. NZSb11 TaxID=980422 RepID=R4RZU5_PHYAS|nr:sigma-70 family RNA polymerase sigma factor [Candidatus Phytoplasma australiense]AGL90054.1 DNA-Directed RNA Polymerase Sigma Subunit [Strawberry lethal yellows phytoplasma (CPA) str. NZSb11]AGL90702.1 DNA-Directed RNA Polymerase Sigma Subunit [Strawberry lethal yellows phytoplasma (CPA) str. NZSb11]
MLRQKLFKDFLKNKNNLEKRNKLIEMHFPLVKKIANQFKYFPKSLQREDLFQEGVLGLINSLKGYEFQEEIDQFIGYAIEHIKFAIHELIRKCQSASMPQKHKKIITKIGFEEWEEAKQPRWSTILNPHQLWLKQANHELFLKKLKNILNPQEFEIIRLSFGIPFGNINEEHQIEYSNKNIGQMLNLSSRQVAIIKNKAIAKLKKIYKKGNK